MHAQAQALVEQQADQFNRGDFAGFASGFAYPCPIVDPEGRSVLRSASDFGAFLKAMATDNRSRGVLRMSIAISAVELVRENRLRVWARWSYHFQDRTEHKPYDSVYYISVASRRRPLIEMVDCLVPATPEADLLVLDAEAA